MMEIQYSLILACEALSKTFIKMCQTLLLHICNCIISRQAVEPGWDFPRATLLTILILRGPRRLTFSFLEWCGHLKVKGFPLNHPRPGASRVQVVRTHLSGIRILKGASHQAYGLVIFLALPP